MLATVVAGPLAVAVHHISTLWGGEVAEPVLVGVFVFVVAAIMTFLRFFPVLKARHDYGLMIFILTYCLVSVSGYRDAEDMDKSLISLPRYHRKYVEGVWDFMQYAQANADGSGMFYCPCKMCKCRSDMHRFPFDIFYQTGSTSNDPTTAFMNDMFPHDSGVCPERQDIPQAPMQAVPRGVNTAGIAKYNRLIAFQQTPLCPGHETLPEERL
ncbi:hypothetical protein ACLB2K_031858 [Fragaria x ananassa]